ncbi:MAG TPA: hypothetical protein VF815_10390, partial [Myxococcaceae bacterium]
MSDPIEQEREEVIKRHGGLELEDSMRMQRRLWKIQRVVRTIALLILALGLAGAFGGGPLSHATTSQGGSSVAYERIAYSDTPQTYHLRLTREQAPSGKARIWFDRETLRRMKLEGIVPEPGATTLAADRTIFEFDATGEQGEFEILFELSTDEAGVHTARAGI